VQYSCSASLITTCLYSSAPPTKKATKSKQQSAKTSTSMPPRTGNTVQLPMSTSESNRDSNGEQEVFWLLKAEPLPRFENGVNVAFSIDDLAACVDPEPWSGVRNPQARNNMQAMRKGDLGFFYHSNAKPSGIVGILRVVEEAKVDESAFDSKDPYYDPKSDPTKPKWYCVGVEFVKKFDDVVDLAKIKSHAGNSGPLENMQLVTNSRLSVCRVRKEEWSFLLGLAGESGVQTQM
jgi:predicted RNA-binding protein with PUA-like domain